MLCYVLCNFYIQKVDLYSIKKKHGHSTHKFPWTFPCTSAGIILFYLDTCSSKLENILPYGSLMVVLFLNYIIMVQKALLFLIGKTIHFILGIWGLFFRQMQVVTSIKSSNLDRFKKIWSQLNGSFFFSMEPIYKLPLIIHNLEGNQT